MRKIGFDNEKYIKIQSEQIRKRISEFGGKLYMEFGGKLFDDHHASRVLPGFAPDSKLKMLLELKEQAEIVIAVSAPSLAANKQRRDLGITYDLEVLRLIDLFRSVGLYVGSVVITQYDGEKAADALKNRLKNNGIPVFVHYRIPGYPSDIPYIVSDEGYGRNDYIETTRSLVVLTAPGPGSGKMAACLSQLYQEHKKGINAGYAKFETFPIWNIPLKHPVNLAYEAATADLNDVNMIDPYHFEAYGEITVNYNRDVEVFPVLNAIFERIYGTSPYKSPTDMGVNMVGNCIMDNDCVCEASNQEILRRYYAALCDAKRSGEPSEEANKIELIMKHAGIALKDRKVAVAALKVEEETGTPAAAIQLSDGKIITGKTKDLLGCSAAVVLNSLKHLAGIPDETELIPSHLIEPVQDLKTTYLGSQNPRLHIDEILIALSVSAADNPIAAQALSMLPKLRGCEAHSSVILSEADDSIFRKLKVHLTCEPRYQSNKLYHL